VLVSENTVSLLYDQYELSPIGEVDIRGKRKSVLIHQLAPVASAGSQATCADVIETAGTANFSGSLKDK